MGTAARVVYEFDHAFWSQFSKLKGASFLFAPDAIPPTWWTTEPWPDATLTGLGGRPEGGPVEPGRVAGNGSRDPRRPARQRPSRPAQAPGSLHQHDWKNDVYTLGSYSYVPRGAIRASEELSVPVEKTLFLRRRTYRHQWTLGHGSWSLAVRLSCRGTGEISWEVSRR